MTSYTLECFLCLFPDHMMLLGYSMQQATIGYAQPVGRTLQVTVPPNAGPGSVLLVKDPDTHQDVQGMLLLTLMNSYKTCSRRP